MTIDAHASRTKEAERGELHKTIWRIANDLRGSVDGRDFKAYVLGMLFYRFILTDPYFEDDEPFEAIVSNPPYPIKWDGDANPLLINDARFAAAGVLAPKSKADLAFTMHMLSWLAVDGTAAIVEFMGVLYRGGAEQKIRKYLVDNNFVDAVIQLPPDLFFGTTIATCAIVLKKSKTDDAVQFVNGSALFTRVGNKNKLTEEHRAKILDTLVATNSGGLDPLHPAITPPPARRSPPPQLGRAG